MLHRYLGVAVGLLMLMWCLSGAVMLFVQYPSLDEAARLKALGTIRWSGWRAPGLDPGAPVGALSVESLAGRPALRVDGRGFDLASGAEIRGVDAATARAVADGFGARAGQPRRIDKDQWTVSGEFRPDRPLYLFAFPNGDNLYVSSKTGRAVQLTSRAGRFWNWLGAVPHWLYPTILRQDAKLWSQVVIWTSLLGGFLTLTGLYVGWVAFRPFGDRRWSRYGGVWLWHHMAGLLFGVLTLAWVFSGLVSMNPWGFLEGSGEDPRPRLQGTPPAWGVAWPALQGIAARPPPGLVSLSMTPLDGRLYFIGRTASGRRIRLNAAGAPAPLTRAELAAAAARLSPGGVAAQGMITREDAYDFSHHDPALLPAYRVVEAGKGAAIDYLDPVSGELVRRLDGDARAYRWLHAALHRWDFIPGLRRGPLWAALVILLLSAASVGVATGVWMSVKAVARDVRRALRRGRAAVASPSTDGP